MSLTILSTPPALAQATANDNTSGSDNAEILQDFASLLFAQFAPASIKLPVEDTVGSDITQAELNSYESALTPDAPVTDTASLLAALGIIPAEIAPAIAAKTMETALPTADVNKASMDSLTAHQPPPSLQEKALETASPITGVGKTSTDSLTAPPSLPGKVPQTETIQKSEIPRFEIPRSIKAEPELAESPVLDSKPAKIAAALSSVTEAVAASKDVVIDTTSNSALAPTPGSSGVTHTLQRHHDVPLTISTPVRDQNWAGELGQKIVWLAASDKQTAQLTLNPPQMGPIEISLDMDKNNATATFVSANAEVREAIETALPRLREMLASAGIELGQANVSSESFRQQTDNGSGNRNTSQWKTDNAILDNDSAGSMPGRSFFAQQGNGLVDIFA